MSLALEVRNAGKAKKQRQKQMEKVLKESAIADDDEHKKRSFPSKAWPAPPAIPAILQKIADY
jgi:hypothetical protein